MEPSKELEKVIESKFLTPQKFAIEIEKIVAVEDLNYIDAILHYCDQNGLEAETVKGLISAENKENLRNDAESLNFFPKTSKLPI